MVSGEDQTISSVNNNNKRGNVFAKILLPVQPGNTLFNTFVPSTKIFNKSINLTHLDINFTDNNGDEYDFQGKDHSFTLEIFQQKTTEEGN